MLAFSSADLINTGLKQWVFPNAEPRYNECVPGVGYSTPNYMAVPEVKKAETAGPTQAECDKQNALNRENVTRERQSSAIRDFSMLIIGLPLFLFHFRIVQKDWKERKEATVAEPLPKKEV